MRPAVRGTSVKREESHHTAAGLAWLRGSADRALRVHDVRVRVSSGRRFPWLVVPTVSRRPARDHELLLSGVGASDAVRGQQDRARNLLATIQLLGADEDVASGELWVTTGSGLLPSLAELLPNIYDFDADRSRYRETIGVDVPEAQPREVYVHPETVALDLNPPNSPGYHSNLRYTQLGEDVYGGASLEESGCGTPATVRCGGLTYRALTADSATRRGPICVSM